MQVLTHDNLSNILKTYAVVNPNLNYCQGMNYMAGFLYLSLKCDESLAFGSMKEIIERYSMSELFNEKLPMVKLMFYQLDRLISIYLPDLHNHFKVSQKYSHYLMIKERIQNIG